MLLSHVPPPQAFVALQAAEKGKAVASSDAFYAVDAAEPVTDWQDYSNYYDEYDDDEEVRSRLSKILFATQYIKCRCESVFWYSCATYPKDLLLAQSWHVQQTHPRMLTRSR